MKHLGTRTLTSPRLILRRTEEQDYIPMFRNWASDPRVTAFLTWTPYESEEQLRTTYHRYLMEQREREDFYDWMIVLRETGEPVGSIGVTDFREDIASAVIGYCLGYDWWHRGLMSEALGEVIRFLIEEVGVNRVTAVHDTMNPRSGNVMKKCGMRYEGTEKQAGRTSQGTLCDLSRYSILREEYEQHQKAKGGFSV